jgi:hypothetical protein
VARSGDIPGRWPHGPPLHWGVLSHQSGRGSVLWLAASPTGPPGTAARD